MGDEKDNELWTNTYLKEQIEYMLPYFYRFVKNDFNHTYELFKIKEAIDKPAEDIKDMDKILDRVLVLTDIALKNSKLDVKDDRLNFIEIFRSLHETSSYLEKLNSNIKKIKVI